MPHIVGMRRCSGTSNTVIAHVSQIAIVMQEPIDAPGPDFNLIDDDSDLLYENWIECSLVPSVAFW